MTSVEWVSITRQATLLDHAHAADHVMVLLDGEMQEDGCVYRAGDIRISRSDDRHFLRFIRPSRCLVIEGAAPAIGGSRRRVLSAPTLVADLRGVRSQEVAVAFAAGDRLADALVAHEPPCWLVELERVVREGASRTDSVETLAQMAGVSREHLSRSYRRHFGTSITAAIRLQRLREAYDSVTQSTLPLADVAGACGFADQSHMTRQFAAWIGLTPGALRANRHITPVQDVLTCTCM